jgi:hypothetical protein
MPVMGYYKLQDPVGEVHGSRLSHVDNFIKAIYFHCGGLNTAPSPTF